MPTDRRTEHVAARVRPRERDLLRRAAEASDRSLSGFIRDAAKLEALNRLSERDDHRQEDRP